MSTEKLGAWRDRTNLFISYRQSYTHHPAKPTRPTHHPYHDGDSERAGLMSNLGGDHNDGDAVIEMDLLPPRWLDIQDEISTILSGVTTKMRKLDHLHAKHVLPGFDDESVKDKEARDIESLTSEITRAFTTSQSRIRRIDTLLAEQRGHSPTNNNGDIPQADTTMARNLKISLATRVSEVSTTFRKKQSAYLRKLRSLDGLSTPLASDRSNTPSGAHQNPYTDPAMMESETDRTTAQTTLLQQTAQSQVRRRTGMQDTAILQREQEIEKIAQGVIDLSNIFQELNTMVIDQGTILDRIDYNVERTAEHVQAAEKELVVATGYQKKGTRRNVIFLLVLIVVGMVILLVIKPKGRGGAVTSPKPAPVLGEPAPPLGPGGGLPPDNFREVVGRARSGSGSGSGRGAGRRRWEWKQRRRRGTGATLYNSRSSLVSI
ncbi:t-SNARE affecting a late Golgi compartment protein 2 [Recurvomyces mirabilis]|uniref:t-SNARE affecting a late Golgi compartment protein 2 n=1 Tax=Recurvomyces mirabilis TaxID=574656 RepID=A0AAE0WQL2_9PEZI|nr:t-SNARE affecting a late Golgi compartment protein 2 [Recurvomyces mirabilis]